MDFPKKIMLHDSRNIHTDTLSQNIKFISIWNGTYIILPRYNWNIVESGIKHHNPNWHILYWYVSGTLMGITNMIATIPGFLGPFVVGVLTNNKVCKLFNNIQWCNGGIIADTYILI
jgi:hypothetical protein